MGSHVEAALSAFREERGLAGPAEARGQRCPVHLGGEDGGVGRGLSCSLVQREFRLETVGREGLV